MFHASEKTAPNSQGQSWKMGKEVGNLIYFQRILWEKTAFLIYLSDSRFFCLFSHLFLVNIASLFLFNAKISCQILWFAKGPHTHTKRSHIVSLPDWDQKKVFTFGKDSQGHLNQEPHATSCNMTATTRCLPLESTSCDARHTESKMIFGVSLFRVSVSPQYLILLVQVS